MDLERSAAALQWRNQHLASVSGEHPSGGSIDLREKGVLHAPCEQRDSQESLASGPQTARCLRSEACTRERWRHVVETAQRRRSKTPDRADAQRPAQAKCLGKCHSGRDRAHPLRIREDCEECGARRAGSPATSETPFNLRANLLDQAVVLHTRGTGVDACHAAEARVPVTHDLRLHTDLAARCQIHEQDATTRGVHLLTPEQIRGACGEAEPAVHAIGDQCRIGCVVVVEGDGLCACTCVPRDLGWSRGQTGHVRCHRPGGPGSAFAPGRAAASPSA